MKKEWNAPSIEELDINETASGFFDSYYETSIILNDNKKPPVTPDNKDNVNQLS